MTTRPAGMYTILDGNVWIAFVYCTILTANGEHGWYGEGSSEVEAIEDLQVQMQK